MNGQCSDLYDSRYNSKYETLAIVLACILWGVCLKIDGGVSENRKAISIASKLLVVVQGCLKNGSFSTCYTGKCQTDSTQIDR